MMDGVMRTGVTSGPGRCPAVITGSDALAAATSCWVVKRAL